MVGFQKSAFMTEVFINFKKAVNQSNVVNDLS